MEKINILFDASILTNGLSKTPARSGVYFVAYNLLLEMSKRENFSIKLYCKSNLRNLLKEVLSVDEKLKNFELIDDTRIDNIFGHLNQLKDKLENNSINKIYKAPVKFALGIIKLFVKIKNSLGLNFGAQKKYKNIDVFVSPHEAVPEDIRCIKHIKKYTILYDVIPMAYPHEYPEMKNKKSWFYQLIKSLNKNDFYFAISEYTKEDFVKYVKNINPAKIIPIKLSTGIEYKRIEDANKIEDVKIKYNIPQDKKYLFSLCTLEPRKNLTFAVKNFIEFIKKNNIDDFVFVLGGGSWDTFMKEINKSIKDLDAFKDKIIKIGYVDDEDMAVLYSAAEMFIFPSVYEGFGMPILEAMQCGCPVICSKVTSIPEVIDDCGIQIDPTQDEDLVKAFEKMYYDRNYRQECIDKGIIRAKEFAWNKCMDTIEREIIKNGVN